MSAIDHLQDILSENYLTRIAPRSESEMQRWQDSDCEYRAQGFRVRPIRREHQGVVTEAIREFDDLVDRFLRPLDMGRQAFIEWFSGVREQFNDNHEIDGGRKERLRLLQVLEYSKGKVRNIAYVSTIVVYLPRIALENATDLRILGQCVTAIFYLEQICKYLDMREIGMRPGTFGLERLEQYWQFVVSRASP
jgi:hypothetical protein